MASLKVIIFDFGSTLIYSKNPWQPIYEQTDRALVDVLKRAGIQLELQAFSSEFDTFLGAYYDERGTSLIEKTTFSVLCELLEKRGFRDVPASVIRNALDAIYAITQQNWYLEDDTIPILETLRERGYRLGMISNTSDDKNVQQLVDRWGLRPYFESIVTSAGCGIRKPDERIFRLALSHFGVPPEAAAMVGDTLEADILGANQIGMYSIWITRRIVGPDPATGSRQSSRPTQSDATVGTLSEIPAILEGIA